MASSVIQNKEIYEVIYNTISDGNGLVPIPSNIFDNTKQMLLGIVGAGAYIGEAYASGNTITVRAVNFVGDNQPNTYVSVILTYKYR